MNPEKRDSNDSKLVFDEVFNNIEISEEEKEVAKLFGAILLVFVVVFLVVMFTVY